MEEQQGPLGQSGVPAAFSFVPGNPIGGEMLRVLRLLLANKASSSKPRGEPGGFPRHSWGPARAPAAGTFLILLGLLLLGGCGKTANLPTLAPVKGKVTVDGNPLTSGQVVL